MNFILSILGIILGSSLVASLVTNFFTLAYQNKIRRIADKKRAYEPALIYIQKCSVEGNVDFVELETKCYFVTLYGSKEVNDKLVEIDRKWGHQMLNFGRCSPIANDLSQLTEFMRKDLDVDECSFCSRVKIWWNKHFPCL